MQPWNYNRRSTKHEYEQAALRRGHVAVNSIIRDTIKGQVTAIECGILSFEAVFTYDGRPLHERAAELLPKPDEPKVVPLLGQRS